VRIAYNTWSMATVPYETFIPGLSEIGFTAIAISVVPSYQIGGRSVENAAALDRLSADDRLAIKRAFKERDLKLPSIVGNQSLVEENVDLNAAAMERLRRSIDLCVELAIDGEVPGLNTGTGGESGDLEDRGKRQMILDRLGSLADYAGQRGVTVCVEPHVNTPVDTVERAEWLVQAIGRPSLRLDFDVSHFEVVGVPSETSVCRLAPLAAAAEIKDQHYRVLGDSDTVQFMAGNGSGRALGFDGREVEFQFLLGGEGTFDLARYLRLMQSVGFTRPIAFEASVQCQARPTYDAMAVAAGVYRWMAEGWRRAGVATD
jgi:inosose dehydratase